MLGRRVAVSVGQFAQPTYIVSYTENSLKGRRRSLPLPDSGGVVDALGHVFDTTSGRVRTDLYIADGSAIPTALGVNPPLTISAVALRTADHIVSEIRAANRVHASAAGSRRR